MTSKPHFATLDAMRAIAAVAVTLFHLKSFLPIAPQSAYLAVDLFFALSGFVIASAYDERLRAGMTKYSFARVRAIRLWPLFALGTALATIMFLASRLTGNPGSANVESTLLNGTKNLFFIPIAVTGAAMFLNPPAWSLMFEVIANAAYAIIFKHLNRTTLTIMMALGLIFTVYFSLRDGTLDKGANWPEIAEGLSRVTFSFFAGIALFRSRSVWIGRISIHPYVLFFAVGACLLVPFKNVYYDLIFCAALSPIFVMSGATYREIRWSRFFGEMSYVVYILHRPLQNIAVYIADKVHASEAAFGILITVALAAATPLISMAYDRPARKLMDKILPAARARTP